MNPFLAADRNHSLRDTVSSILIDYSACSANSWPGRFQLWENLAQDAVTETDEDPQSSGPLYLGGSILETSVDPAFSGQAGKEGSKFTLDGTQYFTYSGQTTAATPVADGKWGDIHKSTAALEWTIGKAFKFQSGAALQTLFSTKESGNKRGLAGYLNTDDTVHLTQNTGAAAADVGTTYALTDNTVYIVFIGHDNALNQTHVGIYDVDGAQLAYEQLAHTFGAVTTAATTPLVFGALLDFTLGVLATMDADSEVYAICGADTLLTENEMDTLAVKIALREGL